MNNQGTDYYADDTAPDSITTELYTQQSGKRNQGSYQNTSSTGSDTGQQLADTAGKVAGQAKDVVGSAVDKAKEQAVTQIDAQKSKATSTLGAVAEAIRQTGTNLRDQDQAPIAQYADGAADQIERLSTYLENRDLNQMVNEVQHMARRQPALFLGGALVAGLLAARFLKSSSDKAQIGTNQSTYNTGGYDAYTRSSSYSYEPGYQARYSGTGTSSDTGRGYAGYSGSSGMTDDYSIDNYTTGTGTGTDGTGSTSTRSASDMADMEA